MQSIAVNVRKIWKVIKKRRIQSMLRAFSGTNTRIPSWTSDNELYLLYLFAKNCPEGSLCVEIGSYLGASTLSLCAGLSSRRGRVICVDTWMNETMPDGYRDTFREFSINLNQYQDMITTIRKRSDQLLPGEIPNDVALAFIDGDHSYEAVNNDFRLIAASSSSSCTVIFHDAKYFKGVSQVIGEALATGEWAFKGMQENTAWISRADFKK